MKGGMGRGKEERGEGQTGTLFPPHSSTSSPAAVYNHLKSIHKQECKIHTYWTP